MKQSQADSFDIPEAEAIPHVAHAVIIKIHDHGSPARIIKLEQLPVTIGRSVYCDIILDHPSISAIHARLERDPIGSLIVSDAGSKNGLWHDGRRVDQVHISPNVTIQLSDIQLEIITCEHLAQTRLDNKPPEALRVSFRKSLLIIASLVVSYALVFAVYALKKFITDWPPDRPGLLFSDALIAWCGVSCIGGILAIFNKLHGKRYDALSLHLVVISLFTFSTLINTFAAIINFNLKVNWLKAKLPSGILLIAIAYAFYRILRIMFASWPHKRHIMAALATVIILQLAASLYHYLEFSAGSRRIWDNQLGMPLIDPKIGAESTENLTSFVHASLKTVDQYQKEDWSEILERDQEDKQESDSEKRH